jgi:1-deoxy-D-xylulose-5-phosphate reductoisomerase
MVYDMKMITILGSTGSIGENSLNVISQLPDEFSVFGISCHKNTLLFYKQIKKYHPKIAVITDRNSYDNFVKDYGNNVDDTEIAFGDDGLNLIIADSRVSSVIVAIVGFACIDPVIEAIKNDKVILIANKEILVSAGSAIISLLKKTKARLIPIDSEHNALLQIILSSGLDYKINDQDYYQHKIKKLTITASGGPFLDLDIKDFKNITVHDAVKHPTWNMGRKISIDSATMMNKGLEIIEAKILFNIDISKIKAIIHRESKIHALVEFFDGSIISHMSNPNMMIPISYALTFPKRTFLNNIKDFDYTSFSFEDVPLEKFPCYKLARYAAETAKNSGLILNAANEISVEYFLENKISFLDIPNIIEYILETSESANHNDFESLIDNDSEIRVSTKKYIKHKYL